MVLITERAKATRFLCIDIFTYITETANTVLPITVEPGEGGAGVSWTTLISSLSMWTSLKQDPNTKTCKFCPPHCHHLLRPTVPPAAWVTATASSLSSPKPMLCSNFPGCSVPECKIQSQVTQQPDLPPLFPRLCPVLHQLCQPPCFPT